MKKNMQVSVCALTGTQPIKGRWVPCSDSMEASRIVREFVARYKLDANTWAGGCYRSQNKFNCLGFRNPPMGFIDHTGFYTPLETHFRYPH